jgi:hypothetical protein
MNSDTLPLPAKYSKPQLRALAREFYETGSPESQAKIKALRVEDMAWLAGQPEFMTFLFASQAKLALGLMGMDKAQQKAQDQFIRAAQRTRKPEKEPKKRLHSGVLEVMPTEASVG